jgi:hypothetical protein
VAALSSFVPSADIVSRTALRSKKGFFMAKHDPDPVKTAALLRAASPPAPTRNAALAQGHEELALLQSIGRLFLSVVINSQREPRHGEILWNLFEDSPLRAQETKDAESLRSFFRTKMNND